MYLEQPQFSGCFFIILILIMSTNPTSSEALAIGIDIGGTGTKFGIVDRDGNVLFSGEMSTKKTQSYKSLY